MIFFNHLLNSTLLGLKIPTKISPQANNSVLAKHIVVMPSRGVAKTKLF